MTDFSATSFVAHGPWGTREFIYADDATLELIIQRNTLLFAQDTFDKLKPPVNLEAYTESIHPLKHGVLPAIRQFLQYLAGRHSKIQGDMNTYMAGWGRQFWAEGYQALKEFCLDFEPKKVLKNIDDLAVLLDDIFAEMTEAGVTLSRSFLFQRFLEWDEERYFFTTLWLSPNQSQDRNAILQALKNYLKSDPGEHEKELLWICLRSLRNGGVISPDHSHIWLQWLDWVSHHSYGDGFAKISSSATWQDVYLHIKDRLEQKKIDAMTPTARGLLAGILLSNVWEPIPSGFLSRLTLSEKESIALALWELWTTRVISPFYTHIFHQALAQGVHISPIIITSLWEKWEDIKKLKQYAERLSPEDVAILFDHLRIQGHQDQLLSFCKKQIWIIMARACRGDITPYSRIVHHISWWRKNHPFDMLFGISDFLPWISPMSLWDTPRLLAGKSITNLIQRLSWTVVNVLQPWKKYERALAQSINKWTELRESLALDFGKKYFPIGGKIHFSRSLTEDETKLLHTIVWFASTSFQLLHADKSLNLPPCESPLQLMAILDRLEQIGVIKDRELQLQLCVAGEIPNALTGISASICLFAKPESVQYTPTSFLTSHNKDTATCIMCYGAGGLETKQFPILPPWIRGRTDMLGFRHIIEAVTYWIVGNLLAQSYYSWPLQHIGKIFVEEYIALLRAHWMIHILSKKWVHTPDTERDPEEEKEHYEVVKFCTDILTRDVHDYNRTRNAYGFSFVVKRFLHDFIVRYNLLPCDDERVQRYLQRLNYKTQIPLSDAVEKLQ